MNKKITPDEAQAALNSVAETKRKAKKDLYPSLWLSILISLSVTICMLATGLSKNPQDFWSDVAIISSIIVLTSSYYSMLRPRTEGVLLPSFPSDMRGQLLFFGVMVIVVLLFLGIVFLPRLGFTWAPMVLSVITGLGVFYLFHRFPYSGCPSVEETRE